MDRISLGLGEFAPMDTRLRLCADLEARTVDLSVELHRRGMNARDPLLRDLLRSVAEELPGPFVSGRDLDRVIDRIFSHDAREDHMARELSVGAFHEARLAYRAA